MNVIGFLTGFIAGIFAHFVILVIRRMFRKYNQCKVEIGDIGILGGDKPMYEWYVGVTVSYSLLKYILAEQMEDTLVGRIIVDEDGKGRSGGYRDSRWIGFHPGNSLEVPKYTSGQLLLLSETIKGDKVYILDHISYGTPLKRCKYLLRIQIRRTSDFKVLASKNIPITITECGVHKELDALKNCQLPE